MTQKNKLGLIWVITLCVYTIAWIAWVFISDSDGSAWGGFGIWLIPFFMAKRYEPSA